MGLMRRKFQLRIISSSALSSEEFHDSLDESGQLGRKSERIGRSSRCSTWITFSFHRLVSNLKSPLPFRASNLASNSIFHRFESSSCCYCHTVSSQTHLSSSLPRLNLFDFLLRLKFPMQIRIIGDSTRLIIVSEFESDEISGTEKQGKRLLHRERGREDRVVEEEA